MLSQYEVKLSSELIEHLKNKGKHSITLDINILGGGCCATFESEEITLSEPQDESLYDKIEYDSIQVYVSRKARIIAPVLHFRMHSGLLIKKVMVDGLSIRKN